MVPHPEPRLALVGPEGVDLRTEQAAALARAICAAPAADLRAVAAKLEVVSALLDASAPCTGGRLTQAVEASVAVAFAMSTLGLEAPDQSTPGTFQRG